MAKEIQSGASARNKAIKALNDIAGIVSSTVGPGGRPILLSRQTSATTATTFHTKDGITVLRELSYTDPINDAVHKLAIQATADTVMASGDGTTSTLIMAAAFANKLVQTSRSNPQSAVRAFRAEVNRAVAAIAEEVVMGSNAEARVALTSTNGDAELTSHVINAVNSTSAFGTVLVEKNPMSKMPYCVDKDYGYQAGNGYSYNVTFAISVSDKAVTNADFHLKNAYVIPYNGNISQVEQITPMLEKMYLKSDTFDVLIVCYEVTEDVINKLIVANRKNPGVRIFICKTTPTAELNGPWNQLNDVAAFSGAVIVDAGYVPRWTLKDAGDVKEVRVTPYKTFLLGKSDKNWIVKRAEQNADTAALATTPLDRDIVNSRNASLTGGLVKLIIGGGLPGDLQEIADRADDAIKASQACRRSGALPGCGLSFIRAGELGGVSESVMEALRSVHLAIVENYGYAPIAWPSKHETLAIRDDDVKVGNFLELGVADSYETVKSVILNGFALGSLVANIGGYCLSADIEEIHKQTMLKDLLLS